MGLIKGIIKRSVGNKILTFSKLRTVSSYAEAISNSRPLHVLSSSDPDFIPITPNMLVYEDNLRMLAHDMLDIDLNDPDFNANNKNLNVMARKLRDTLASVRKQFKNDYFNFLTQKDSNRSKNSPFSKSPILPKVDHYVLIKDDNTSDLKIGKIIEVLPSSDNEIRQVMVKTAHSTGIFPTFKLRYLEGYREEDLIRPVPENKKDKDPVRIKIPRKAKSQVSSKIQEAANNKNDQISSLFFLPSYS